MDIILHVWFYTQVQTNLNSEPWFSRWFTGIDIFMSTAIIYLIIYMYITYSNSMNTITLSVIYNKYKQTLLDISFCIWVTSPDVMFFSFLALSNSIFSWLVSLLSVSKTDTGETGWWSCNRLSCKSSNNKWSITVRHLMHYHTNV